MKETKINLYLIRHGQAENQIADIVSGRSEWANLTDLGMMQATALGRRFAEEGVRFDAVYTSPLKRSFQTTDLVLQGMGLQIRSFALAPQLTERSSGRWEGCLREDVYTDRVVEEIERKHYWHTPPGGESGKMVEKRFREWFDHNVMSHPRYMGKESTIALFSHADAIRSIFRSLTGCSEMDAWRMFVDNTSVTRLRYCDGVWVVEQKNDASHLEGSVDPSAP